MDCPVKSLGDSLLSLSDFSGFSLAHFQFPFDSVEEQIAESISKLELIHGTLNK
jgi:hypothetical protein